MTILDQIKRKLGKVVKPGLRDDEELDLFEEASGGRPEEKKPHDPLRRPSPNIKQEEEAPTYTHGFESIYALENVDVKTVRRMMPTKAESLPMATIAKKPQIEDLGEGEELEFDLGEDFRGWIESFRLLEPIQVLRLSSMAEKGLIDNERKKLKDLLDLRGGEAVYLKGLGQGHIDEIRQKLEDYIGGIPLHRSRRVDLIGLLRCLLGTMDPLQVSLCLEAHGLELLFPLPASKAVELRHLSPDKRREAWAEAALEAASGKRSRFMQENLARLARVFIRPWIRQRLGIAQEYEITDRLQRIVVDASTSKQVLNFLSEVYCEGRFPFAASLETVEKGVYCVDSSTARAYRSVVKCARSYFYNSRSCYSMSELVAWIERELSLDWISFSEGFVEKVLRVCPEFQVRKGRDGELSVRRMPVIGS